MNYALNGRSPVFLAAVTSGPEEDEYEILDIAVVGADGEILFNTALLPSRPDKGDPDFLARVDYSDGAWAPSPSEDDVGLALLGTLEGRVVVGHDVQRAMRFVRPVIRRVLEGQGVPPGAVDARMLSIDSPWIDTTTLAWEHLVPCGLQSLSLTAVSEFLGVDASIPTSALQEARATREIYDALLRAPWWRRWFCWWR